MNTYSYKYSFDPNTFALGYSGSDSVAAENELEALHKAAVQQFSYLPWDKWEADGEGGADFYDDHDQRYRVEITGCNLLTNPETPQVVVNWDLPPQLSCTVSIPCPGRSKEDLADDLLEAVLIHLSEVRLVGDSLEAITDEEYDKLETDLLDLILKEVKRG